MTKPATPAHNLTTTERAAASSRLDAVAAAVLVTLCIVWGVNQVAIKVAIAGIPPILQSGVRSAGAAILLLLWCRARGIALFARDGTLLYGIAAGLLFGMQFLTLFWGLAYTNASRAVILLHLAPFIVALGSHYFVDGERLSAARLVGLGAAFTGIVVAFADGFFEVAKLGVFGDALCVAAAIFWGATTVLIKASPLARLRAEKTLFYQLVVSTVLLLGVSAASGEATRYLDLQPLVLAALAFQIVLIAFASYLIWFWLVRHYSAPRLAAFTFLTPLFGVIAGAVLLGEKVTAMLIIALLLVALGIYLVNRPERDGA